MDGKVEEHVMKHAWLDKASVDDTATWPTKATLRQELGWQDRMIERWVQKGHLRTVNIRPQGFKSFPAYNPDDVRKMLKETRRPVGTDTATQATIIPVPTSRPVATLRPTDRNDIATLAKSIDFTDKELRHVAVSSLTRWGLSLKTMLTLEESAKLTGYSRDAIKALFADGVLLGDKGRGKSGHYKFKRTDLETIPMSEFLRVVRKELATDIKRHTDNATAL